MVEGVSVQRMVLVADSAVESLLIHEIERLGCIAYSSVHCAGRGARGVMDDDFSSSTHVRIEVLGDEVTLRRLARFVHEGPLSRYSIVSFVDSVEMHACVAVA